MVSNTSNRPEAEKKPAIKIEVHCYAGYRAEETPRSIRFQTRKIEVKQVLDQWLDPDHRYFKLLGEDEAIYIVRFDTHNRTWELTFYQESAGNRR
jgi:hypothetical protein